MAIASVLGALLLGIPVVLAVIAANQDDAAPAPDATPPAAGRDDIDDSPVDVEDLEGQDAVFGQLLNDIDASERAMLGFQDDLVEALQHHLDGDPDQLLEAIREAARDGQAALAAVRERLTDPLEDAAAERVRAVYVDHLDSWARYMAAVEEDPALISPQGDDSRYTLAINITAADFARALRAELPDDIDAEVRRLAEAILQRGFDDVGAPDA